MSSNKLTLIIAGGACAAIAVVAVVWYAQGHQQGVEWENHGIISTQVQQTAAKQSRLQGLNFEYIDVPNISFLPCSAKMNNLGLDQRQMDVVMGIEKSFLPHYQERMGQANRTIQDAWVKYLAAKAGGNAAGQEAARQAMTEGVAAHKKTVNELNKEFHDAMAQSVLTPKQLAYFPLTTVDRSPMPKM